MRKLTETICVALCSFGIAAGPISAATLEVGAGTASVNGGQGFKAATTGATVSPGESVMISPGGSGRVVHDNGCVLQLAPGAVLTVGSAEQCAKVVGQQQTTGGSLKDGGSGYSDPHGGAFGGFSPATVVVGAAVVGAVGVGVYLATKKSKTSP